MLSTCLRRRATTALTAATTTAATTPILTTTAVGTTSLSSWHGSSMLRGVSVSVYDNGNVNVNGSCLHAQQQQQQQLRWKSSSSSSAGGSKKNKFKPRGHPRTRNGYYARLDRSRAENSFKPKKLPGPREPNDVKTPLPRIDKSRIRIRDTLDADEEDDLTPLGTLMGGTLRALRAEAEANANANANVNAAVSDLDSLEAKLRTMDFFTSADGSTEDLVGARRAVAAETYDGSADEMLRKIDELVDEERFAYMDLPKTEFADASLAAGDSGDPADVPGGAAIQIPRNQLAHGDWGEMLIRTDRVSKMWRGGRVVSFRALVIGGNLRGCGGFGLGKAFEPEDAVEIACRMAKRNIFFVDRYRGKTLTRDLVGRQNSCKVVLRPTTNGLRGNPLCCEILKLFGITNVVAKAHGSRNHYNVVRATYKALLTHESLDEIAMKRGLRLVNLQRSKRLGI